jgi:hypothetical protein
VLRPYGVRPGKPSGPLTPKKEDDWLVLSSEGGERYGAGSLERPAVTMDAERGFRRGFRIRVRGRSCYGSW